ncbi:MAG: alpha/beta hydrolase [Solirubrobacteraceae bacterium]
MEFQTISSGGQPYVVSTAGDGPDILLLHGFPDTPYSWSEIEAGLVQAGWRVSVPWLRGYHQDTIVGGRRYDPETIGRDALGLLDALGASQAVLVGHDWGALAAFSAASLAPERVRAIVTFGIPHPSVLTRSPAALWAVRHFFGLKLPWAPQVCRRNDFAYLDRLYRRWAPSWHGSTRDQSLAAVKQALSSPATLEGAIGYYRDLPLGKQPAVVAHVPQVPGLVVGGTEDLADPELFKRTAELMPSPSRALVLDGAGHWPHREKEAVVVGELQQFLAQIGD